MLDLLICQIRLQMRPEVPRSYYAAMDVSRVRTRAGDAAFGGASTHACILLLNSVTLYCKVTIEDGVILSMTTHVEYPPHYLRNSRPQERRWVLVLYVCAVIMVAAVGVLGLERVSWLRRLVESWINIHALFGLLLCGLVLARHQWIIRQSPRLREDTRALSRHLSRIVYLMLYLVLGASQGIRLVNCIWHGGALDLTLFDEVPGNDGGGQAFDPYHDYHMILLSGGVALAMVRVFLTGCLLRMLP